MANYTAVASGGDWNVSTTWSPVGVPTALDTAILNSASGNVTVPALGSNCVTLTLTGYTGTLLLNGNLTIATSGLNLGSFTGTINFNAGDIILPDGLFNLGNASIYTTLGTGGVRITKPSASFSIFNTNNKIWNCKFALGAAGSTSPTIYFEDNPLEVTGLVSFQATTTGTINLISADIFTPNLVFLKMSGNFTISGSTIYTTTTSGQNIGITGSSNQTLTASGTHQLRCPLRIDKTGGVLTLSGTLNYNTGTLTYVASGGTVNAGSSTLNIGASATLDTNGITWNNVSLNNGTITLTLTSDFNISGTFTASGLSGALTLTFAGVGQFLPTGAFVTNDSSVNTGGVLTITITLPNNISISSFTYTDNSGAVNRRNVTLNGNRNIFISSDVYLGSTRGSTISGTCTLVPSGLSNNFTLGVTGGAFSGIYSIPVNFSGNYTIIGNPLFISTTITYTSGNITGAACIFTTCTLNLNSGGLWGTDVTIRGNTTLTSNATFGNLTTNTNNVGLTGAFTINVEGNLAINIATSGASTPIVLNGTGSQSWTHAGAVYLSNNLTINKSSGTLTIGTLALPNIYYNTGTLTYNNIGGIVDAATNNSTLNLITVSTLNTNGIIWNNVSATSGTHSIASNFYCNNFSSSNSAINFNNTGGDIYLYKSLTQGVAQLQGTATIYFVGGVTWNQTSLTANHNVKNNIVIDTSETVTFGSYVAYSTGTLTYKRGKVNVKGCTFSIQTATTTLINCNKINFDRVVIDAGLTVIMNEFFNGSPELQTAVSSTTTTNAIITFTDNFEKIAKFINVNGITLTRPQQLLLLTNQPKKSRNRGIRYNNQSPNGSPKNDPSVQNQMTYSVPKYLVGDPNMIKSI